MIGSRWMTRQIAVPIRILSVASAIVASATNGSWMREYSRGSSPPAGWALSREAGMWVCSVTNTDSNPRASQSRASSAGAIASSVGK